MNSKEETRQYYQTQGNQNLVMISETSSSSIGSIIDHEREEKEKLDIDDDDDNESEESSIINSNRQNIVAKSTQEQFKCEKECEEVKQVDLFGVIIIALTINNKERLCLAQISNTLLKGFSYNEIHNRRVALGITCVQCTPIQLEMLRRAGAMPSSSRRCGMITRREAERLCRSFLVEEQPPELPENFHFSIAHRVNYGCKGRFIPARYISSRAKCIECYYCGEFYSPNKFIFHSHRQPNTTDCNPPDSPNINSWRKHIDLDVSLEHSQDIKYAWEDVKSLFNGGTRRRAPNWTNDGSRIINTGTSSKNSCLRRSLSTEQNKPITHKFEEDQLIDVECEDNQLKSNGPDLSDSSCVEPKINFNNANRGVAKLWPSNSRVIASSQTQPSPIYQQQQQQQSPTKLNLKRSSSSSQHQSNSSKRPAFGVQETSYTQKQANRYGSNFNQSLFETGSSNDQPRVQLAPTTQSNPFCDFLNNSSVASTPTGLQHHNQLNEPEKPQSTSALALNQMQQITYPASNFIYNQLYTQLIQPAQHQQQNISKQMHQATNSPIDTQLALRQHIWSSLIANLQCQASNQIYNLPQQQVNRCTPQLNDTAQPIADISRTNLTDPSLTQADNTLKLLNSSNQTNPLNVAGYKSTTAASNLPFPMHKFPTNNPGDLQ